MLEGDASESRGRARNRGEGEGREGEGGVAGEQGALLVDNLPASHDGDHHETTNPNDHCHQVHADRVDRHGVIAGASRMPRNRERHNRGEPDCRQPEGCLERTHHESEGGEHRAGSEV